MYPFCIDKRKTVYTIAREDLPMIIRMDKENKLAKVWMNRADQQNPAQKKHAEDFYRQCREQHIFVATYESGCGDVAENTAALLHYNCC